MKQLQLQDYPIIKPYLEKANYEGYNSNFVTTMMWNHEYHIEYTIHNHSLIMLHNYKGTKYFAMPFTTKEYYKDALTYMIDYSKKHHFPFMIDCSVPSFYNELKKILPFNFIYERERDLDDYIYEKALLVSLKGKKMQKRRNHYNSFVKQYPHFIYKQLDLKKDFSLILKCLTIWEKDQKASESLTSEVYGILFLLSTNNTLNIKIGGIFINDELKAFIIGSPLNHSTIQIHVEKADKNIRGLYPAICKHFLENEFTDYKYVNREEDMGIEGLRKSKMQLHPEFMIEKCRIFLNDTYIREAKDTDINEIKQLWLKRFNDEDISSTNFYFNNIYPKAKTYLTIFHNKIISVLSIEKFKIKDYEDSYYIMGVLTDKKYEKQGIMKTLFNNVLNKYKDKRIYLSPYNANVYKSLNFKVSHLLYKIKLKKELYTIPSAITLTTHYGSLNNLYNKYILKYNEYRLRDKDYYNNLFIPKFNAFNYNIKVFTKK